MSDLRGKISDPNQPVIFYELLPPPKSIAEPSLEAYVQCAIDLLADSPIVIDAVNIPDIRAEENTHHDTGFQPKILPGYFAQMLERASQHQWEVLLNHCTVYENWRAQKKWLQHAVEQCHVHSLVLVGGSSSQLHYPGPSVLQLSDYVKQHYGNQVLCGGIAIQTRRHGDGELDEPQRMINKSEHGIEFFTSQIVYDATSVKLLLRDYQNLCIKQHQQPKRVFLSFAPISTAKDLEFMRWLGVIIPSHVEHELFKTDLGIGWRSAQISARILADILQYMDDEKINVPLGLNIEHITRHNFELSLKFIERLGGLYYRH